MSDLLGYSILGLITFCVLAMHCWQCRVWQAKELRWDKERARLTDAALSTNSGDFRVRQTTPVVQYDGKTVEKIAHPNKREPRPIPLGL